MIISSMRGVGVCTPPTHGQKEKKYSMGKMYNYLIYKGSCTKIPCFYSSVVFVSAERDKNTMEECISHAIILNNNHLPKLFSVQPQYREFLCTESITPGHLGNVKNVVINCKYKPIQLYIIVVNLCQVLILRKWCDHIDKRLRAEHRSVTNQQEVKQCSTTSVILHEEFSRKYQLNFSFLCGVVLTDYRKSEIISRCSNWKI